MRSLIAILLLAATGISSTLQAQVGHWQLNNNYTDSSPNNIPSTLIGTPSFSTDSKEGSHSLVLNNTNMAVDLGTPSSFPTGNQSRTIAAWAKTSILVGDRMIFSMGTPSTGQAMFIGQSSASLFGGGSGGNFNMTVPNFWAVDTWHHICMTYDGATARLYADGEEVGFITRSYNLVLTSAFIGKNVNTSGWWFGSIDDVRVYDRALSSSEVAALATGAPSAPQAPTGLSAVAAGPSQVDLSWVDNSANETGFRIERSQTSASTGFSEIATVSADVITYQDMGLTPATQYFYRVYAVNTVGASVYTETNATTSDIAPIAPSDLAVTASTTSSITLSWTDNSSNETGFEIDRSNTENGTYTLRGTVATNVTTFTDTGLQPSPTFYYRVRSVNSTGGSAYTTSVSGTTSPSVGGGPIGIWSLNGDAQDDSGNGAHGTIIGTPTFSTDRKEGSHALLANGSAQFIDLGNPTNFPAGNSPRTIAAWAKASTVVGDQIIFSYGNNSTGQAMFIGRQSSNLLSGAWSSNLTVSGFWSADTWHHICLTYDGTTARLYADGELVNESARSWNLVLSKAFIGKHLNNTGFWNGLIDDVRIYDRALGSSEVQALAGQVPSSVPAPPSDLMATATSSTAVQLSWIDNSANETGFEIERSLTSGSGFALVYTTVENQTQYSDENLYEGTTYYYRVRAINALGESEYTTESNASPASEAILPPGNLMATGFSSSSIHLNWSDNSTNETGFEIERSTALNGVYSLVHTTSANATEYYDNGLNPDTEYFYRVRGKNNTLVSSYSLSASQFTYGTEYEKEYVALRDFYYGLNGPGWTWSGWWSASYPPNASYRTFAQWRVGGQQVDVLDLPNDNLHGIIPATFWNLSDLMVLRLSRNRISGFSPARNPNLDDLIGLYELDLSHNEIKIVPEYLGEIWGLQNVNLSYNQIESIPSTITQPPYLYDLHLGNNQLTSLPDFVVNGFISVLGLADNKLTEIPEAILNLYGLSNLNVSRNLLTRLPDAISSLPIYYLDFSRNDIKDFPEDFYFDGYYLDASMNKLDFADLEPLMHLANRTFMYAPQKKIDDITGLNVSLNTVLEILSREPGQHSTIIWEKLEQGAWVNVNHLNEDPTLVTFRRNDAATSDAGTYRWKMTNSLVTGLTLESENIEVQVTNPTADVLNNLAFQYRYDGRRRLTHKKVPGADWVYMVYDQRDRLVMTQDGNQRSHKDENGVDAPQWNWTKYDQLNRPILTGIYTHNAPMQQDEMSALISTTNFFETRDNGAPHGYTNTVFSNPAFIQGNFDVLTATYYDDNTCEPLIPNSASFKYNSCDLENQYVYSGTTCGNKISFPRLKGMVTATKTRVLGETTPTWLWSVNHYDDKGRMVQNISTNALGGIDRISNVYDFVGKVLTTKTIHNLGTAEQKTIARKFDYDHAGRLLKTWHNVDGGGDVLLSKNEYNELGQLVTKKLHNTDTETAPDAQRNFEQEVDYRYNIRGWLTSINDPSAMQTEDLFGMNLRYNTPTISGIAPQFNGNISQIDWKGADAENQQYGYDYDPMNRLVEAKYYNTTNTLKNGRFNEKIWDVVNNKSGYDLNGNILALQRQGRTGADPVTGIMTYGLMDNLTYAYRGNQLLKVGDTGNLAEGFRDGANNDDDYIYDPNGNMQADKNKGIDGVNTATGNSLIQYNYLNLPEVVRKNTGEYIRYSYDATGRKLRQEVYNASNQLVKKSIYAGEFFYEGESESGNAQPVLKFVNTEEGRIVMADETPEYQYHLKDHLGNVRLTFTTKEETETALATYENSNAQHEEEKFLRTEHVRKVYSHFLDKTNGTSPGYAQRLSGGTNERYGLGRSIAVMPGDKITAEVHAKYIDGTSTNPDFTTLLSAIAGQLNGTNPSGPVVDGGSFPTSTETFPFPDEASQVTGNDTGTAGPRAYLNWLVFDGDYNFIPEKSGYVRVPDSALETGDNGDHSLLPTPEIHIEKAGFVYIYLSNEEDDPLEVYFDDFKVEHVKSPVVQMDDYYPFGLTFNSYSRENSVPQNFLYQEKEWQQDLNLNLYDFEWRQYDPLTARTTTMDPHADRYPLLSPYSWAANNPISIIDPDGQDIVNTAFGTTYTGADAQNMFRQLQAHSSTSSNSNGDPGGRTFYSFNSRTQARREQMASEAAQREKENQPGFWSGMGDGIVAGGESTIDFFKSLGTTQGWKELGYGALMFAQLASPTPNYTQVQFAAAVGNYIENIPNMSAYEIGYDLGYGTEKLAESILFSKGAGAAARFLSFGANGGYGVSMNLGRLGKFEFMYRNPSVRGGTLFSYKSAAGGKFRLDYHSFSSRGKTLHFHTNYGGYSISPHRSINPFRFGQPIK